LGPFVWGLLWKRTSKLAAITSSVVSLALCVGLYIGGTPSPQAGTIGMLASLISAPLISLVLPDRQTASAQNR
ncbi:MAG: hypothetical protein IPH75_06430, partial [bacterium]|nr:hypothetical protein [bacterium]